MKKIYCNYCGEEVISDSIVWDTKKKFYMQNITVKIKSEYMPAYKCYCASCDISYYIRKRTAGDVKQIYTTAFGYKNKNLWEE